MNHHDNDTALIDLYWQRDERAIRETSACYGTLCMRVAMNILGNSADAEECVSDAYLKVWNTIPPERPSVFSAFIARITRNLALDRYRSRHREMRDDHITLMLSELEACIPAPEEGDEGGLLDCIQIFLRGCDELDRKLFVGRYFHGYEVKVMAKNYGLTPNAASLRLHKTRERLRTYLSERGYDV